MNNETIMSNIKNNLAILGLKNTYETLTNI